MQWLLGRVYEIEIFFLIKNKFYCSICFGKDCSSHITLFSITWQPFFPKWSLCKRDTRHLLPSPHPKAGDCSLLFRETLHKTVLFVAKEGSVIFNSLLHISYVLWVIRFCRSFNRLSISWSKYAYLYFLQKYKCRQFGY